MARAGPATVSADAEERRQAWVTRRLVEYGRMRARTLGWPDVYTFTKAMGERAVEDLAHAEGLSLSIAVGTTLPKVRTDPSHLRQILVHLLGNAVKYTEHGGIAVRARRVSAAEKLPTRDGAGMSPPGVQQGLGPSSRGDGAGPTSTNCRPTRP